MEYRGFEVIALEKKDGRYYITIKNNNKTPYDFEDTLFIPDIEYLECDFMAEIDFIVGVD